MAVADSGIGNSNNSHPIYFKSISQHELMNLIIQNNNVMQYGLFQDNYYAVLFCVFPKKDGDLLPTFSYAKQVGIDRRRFKSWIRSILGYSREGICRQPR